MCVGVSNRLARPDRLVISDFNGHLVPFWFSIFFTFFWRCATAVRRVFTEFFLPRFPNKETAELASVSDCIFVVSVTVFFGAVFFSCTGFFKEQILGNRYLPVRARNPATELSNGPTIELMKMLFDRFMRKKNK